MVKKLILGLMGLAIVVAGIAAFAAFTAQVVNLTARVEKEIELSAVSCDIDDRLEIEDPNTGEMIPNPDLGKILPETCEGTDGDYGVVLPQTAQDKIIELTLSKSFFKQDKWFDVKFDVLWECKQAPHDFWNNSVTDAVTGKYTDDTPDTIPDCRDNLPHTDADLDLCADDAGNLNAHHVGDDGQCFTDDDELDDTLRDYIDLTITGAVGITNGTRCLEPTATRGSEDENDVVKDIWFEGGGILDKGARKCFYNLKLTAPPCEQGYNKYTDPDPPATPIPCHSIDTGDPPVGDPQDLETFADLGDDFKIQVWQHSLPP